MLARIRAATSGSLLLRAVPREARSPAAHVRVVRDLDLTAAYGIEVGCPRKGQRGWRPDSGQPVTEPQLDHAPAMPVQPADPCDQGSCPAFVQVSIQTPAGPVDLCAHHYDTNFAALVARLCDHAKHIGDLKPRG